jgi:hypothetical protein
MVTTRAPRLSCTCQIRPAGLVPSVVGSWVTDTENWQPFGGVGRHSGEQ